MLRNSNDSFPMRPYITGKVSAFGVSGYSGAGATPNDKNDPQKLK